MEASTVCISVFLYFCRRAVRHFGKKPDIHAVEVSYMGQRTKNNFNKRFGGRIRIVYAQKTSASEKQLQYGKLCKAIIKVLSGIIGREPTQREILGLDEIPKKIKRQK